MREPTSALDALLESETTIGHFTVHPLTIQRAAVLELMSSPFIVSTKDQPTEYDVMAVCYAMTASAAELRNVKSCRMDRIKNRVYDWWGQNRKSLLKHYADILMEFQRQLKLCSYVAPESTGERKTKGVKSSNGWLAQTLYMAMQMGMTIHQAIEETPLCQLLLMRRQKQYNDIDGTVWTLMDKELSDRMDRRMRASKASKASRASKKKRMTQDGERHAETAD